MLYDIRVLTGVNNFTSRDRSRQLINQFIIMVIVSAPNCQVA